MLARVMRSFTVVAQIFLFQQELYYVPPRTDNKDLGQLYQLMHSTPASPAFYLPICAITVTVRHLQFKTIASVLSQKTPSSYFIKLSICFSQV